jgi:hypothetical protein
MLKLSFIVNFILVLFHPYLSKALLGKLLS